VSLIPALVGNPVRFRERVCRPSGVSAYTSRHLSILDHRMWIGKGAVPDRRRWHPGECHGSPQQDADLHLSRSRLLVGGFPRATVELHCDGTGEGPKSRLPLPGRKWTGGAYVGSSLRMRGWPKGLRAEVVAYHRNLSMAAETIAPPTAVPRTGSGRLRQAFRAVGAWVRKPDGVRTVIFAVLALRVLFWLPVGNSPDGGNTFAPVMPVLTPFGSLFSAWNGTQDLGFANGRIAWGISQYPFYIESALRLNTWAATAVWLFILYFMGSVFIAIAARQLFPRLGAWPAGLILVGVAYQLSPALWFRPIDTSAYELIVGYYWAIPLLFWAVVRAARSTNLWWGPVFGGITLLFSTTFPASLSLLPLLVPLLLWAYFDAARQSQPNRSAFPKLIWTAAWIVLWNAWWAITEFGERASLVSSVAGSAPNRTWLVPNHLLQLLWLNPLWPTSPAWLPYLGTGFAIAGGFGLAVVAFSALFSYKQEPIVIGFVVAWGLTLLFEYSYGAPLGPYYLAFVQLNPIFYVLRDPVRFSFFFNFLTSILFGLGAWTICDRAWNWYKLRLPRTPLSRTVFRLAYSRNGRVSPVARIGIPVGFAVILLLAGFPLVTGEQLVNSREPSVFLSYNQPQSPTENGVKVPSYYSAARSWIADHDPGTTTMVFPAAGRTLSDAAGSNLSWGYQGQGTIYSTLFPTPVIFGYNQPPGASYQPGVQQVYLLAANGGPPGNGTNVSMTGPLTDLYTGPKEQENFTPNLGPPNVTGITWTLNPAVAADLYGIQLAISGLPPLTKYVSFWVRSSWGGDLGFKWANSTESSNAYPVQDPTNNWARIVIPLVSASVVSHPGALPASEISNATGLDFTYRPNEGQSCTQGQCYVTIQLTGLETFTSTPEGLEYYLQGLGVGVVAVDRSIQSNGRIPTQDLSLMQGALSGLGAPSATFGNVTLYQLPGAAATVSATAGWGTPDNYFMAYDERSANSPEFILNSTAMPSNGAASVTGLASSDSYTYTVQVSASTPFLLTLRQNYDPGWLLCYGGACRSSQLIVDGYANGWIVNATGALTLKIMFQAQDTLVTIAEASLVLGGLLAVLSIGRVRAAARKVGRKTRSWIARP